MKMSYDFSGWATRNDLKCSDGRTIRRDAFKHCDGKIVPLVWNHQHNSPDNVLGHALLENREDGVYAYCSFNDSESGKAAKLLVQHGDVESLSIYANGLKQSSSRDVMHGDIREVSLVVAGANPGAFIDFVDLAHGEGGEQELILCAGEEISLSHSEKDDTEQKKDGDKEETVEDVFNTLSEKQKTVVYALLGAAMENEENENKKEEKIMKHNVFERLEEEREPVLSHSDMEEIVESAKMKSVGTLQTALKMYAEQNADVLQHGFDEIETLFPEHKDLRSGAPELITRDQGWVTTVMNKVHKSPISRIRTRQMDARGDSLRASGYRKGEQKQITGNAKLIKRTTDPQTVYVKDKLERDDIVDITDFDVVEYQYGVMRLLLNEELATAIMIGDGREEGDEQKIYEEHIRPIWKDDDLYTIHYDVDISAAKGELQGNKTDQRFGENYVYAEAIITAALYAREKYKGTGTPDFFCTPHLVNVMLLARDMNGRRIYDSKSDLAAALNVGQIYTAEQFEGLIRKDEDNKQHKLLGLFVNLADYTVGHTKGGEITRFNQFDIDFNQEKYLIETRLSGALTRIHSAIALEEPVKISTPTVGG